MKTGKILIFILLFTQVKIFSQTHIVFWDDTVYYKNRYTTSIGLEFIDFDNKNFTCFTEQSDRFSNWIFKDSLKNGKWELHDLYKKDSLNINDESVIMTGYYKDWKKQGTFLYYDYTNSFYLNLYSEKKHKKKFKNEYIKFLRRIENYRDGFLNGLTTIKNNYNPKYSISESNYINGKKNGVETIYYRDLPFGRKYLNIYRDDTLYLWYKFKENGILQISGELIDNNIYLCTVYDTLGKNEYKLFYTNGILNSYQKYDSLGYLLIEAEGKFRLSKFIEDNFDCLIKTAFIHPSELVLYSDYALGLIDGTIKFYNEQGVIIKENKYVDGKVVE
jgi:hypothetical protein